MKIVLKTILRCGVSRQRDIAVGTAARAVLRAEEVYEETKGLRHLRGVL